MDLHQQRSQHYFRLSTQLALLDNQQLAARLVTDAPAYSITLPSSAPRALSTSLNPIVRS